jgi:thiamine kinase-like enzyme
MSLTNISSKFTKETLLNIIEEVGGSQLVSWEFAGGFKKGDSFLAEVYKLKVIGKNDRDEEVVVNLVIKAMPKNKGRRISFRSAEFFRNEINFYNEIVDYMNKFQELKPDVKNKFTEFAKCFIACGDGENDFVCMEDLTYLGYTTASRQNAFDMNLCRLIMQTLGRFHAMSFVLRDQSPAKFEELTHCLDETYYAARLKSWYNDFIKTQVEMTLDALAKEYGGTDVEKCAKKFLCDGDIYDKMVKLTHTRNRFSVFGHGDTWTPNFLFHFEEFNGQKIPVRAKIIDFQLSRFASPAIDISFFIYSCTSQELREQHYEDLLKAYHRSLTDLIREFGSNPEFLFPYSALQNEMKEFARFGVGMGIESVQFSIMDDSQVPDMDAIPEDRAVPITEVWVLKPIENQEGRKRLTDIFKHAMDMGYLD